MRYRWEVRVQSSPLIVAKDPATGIVYKVCKDDFETQEMTVALMGYSE